MAVLLVLWPESAFIMGIIVLGFICFHLLEKYIKPYLSSPKYPKYKNSSLRDHVWKLEYYMRIEEVDDRKYICAVANNIVTIEISDGTEGKVKSKRVLRDTPDGYNTLPHLRTARSGAKKDPSNIDTYYISDAYTINFIDDIRIEKVNGGKLSSAKSNDDMYDAIMDAFDNYYDVNNLGGCCETQTIADRCSRLIPWEVVMTKKITDGKKLVYCFTQPFAKNDRICTVKGFAYWMEIWFLSLTERTFFGFLKAIRRIDDICDDVGISIKGFDRITNIASNMAVAVSPEISYPSPISFYGDKMNQFISRNFETLVDTDVVTFNNLLKEHQAKVKYILYHKF